MTAILDAAFNLVHDYPGGAVALAPRIGKNAATLSHEVSPNAHYKFGLVDAVKVSMISKNLAILSAFAAEMNCTVLALPDREKGVDTLQELGALAKEFGEYVSTIADAHKDGQITDNELARIRIELTQLVAAAQDLEQTMATMNAELPRTERHNERKGARRG